LPAHYWKPFGWIPATVGIAQAIIHKPDFIVLDEPTNGLDPNQILECQVADQEIARERTVLLSTQFYRKYRRYATNLDDQ